MKKLTLLFLATATLFFIGCDEKPAEANTTASEVNISEDQIKALANYANSLDSRSTFNYELSKNNNNLSPKEYKEEIILLVSDDSGGNTVNWTFDVARDGKMCRYNYIVGHYNGFVKDSCTGKEHDFTVRNENENFTNKKPWWSPIPYLTAYKMMTKDTYWSIGTKMISKLNSKGVKIYCLDNMSMCKTENEVKAYSNHK